MKNAPGNPKDSPDSARAMLTAQCKKWLAAAGIAVTGNGQLELGPFVTYRGEGLEALKEAPFNGKIDASRDVCIDAAFPGAKAEAKYAGAGGRGAGWLGCGGCS